MKFVSRNKNTTRKIRTIVYIMATKEEKKADNGCILRQIAACKKYCFINDRICVGFYMEDLLDKERNDDRSKLSEIFERVGKRDFDEVVVYSIDRIVTPLRKYSVIKFLIAEKISVVSIKEHFDVRTSWGLDAFYMLSNTYVLEGNDSYKYKSLSSRIARRPEKLKDNSFVTITSA